MSTYYVAILERNGEGETFAHLPDLPGVTAAGATESEALALATEFANDYVRDLVEDGHAVPPARRIDEIAVDPEVTELARALVPVELPGKSVKISLSIDEALLARADRAAAAEGLTRSGIVADALGARLRYTPATPPRQEPREDLVIVVPREAITSARAWHSVMSERGGKRGASRASAKRERVSKA